MATIKVFEELEIWQRAAGQCDSIFKLIEEGRFQNDKPLADQLNRSSGSVMDNIEEGFDRFTRADFRHFLIVARGSNAEVRSQLYRAKARRHISEAEASKMIPMSKQLGIKITHLIQHLDKSEYKAKPVATHSIDEPDIMYLATESYDLPSEFVSHIENNN